MTASHDSRTLPIVMGKASTSPSRRRRARFSVIGCCLLAASLLAVTPVVYAVGKKPKKTDGPYTITIGGSCTGSGRATVKKTTITIRAQVQDAQGNKGPLVATLVIDGDHFQGVGTVVDSPATFFGRLDGYDGDKTFRGARLLCSYTDSKGHSGRIAGPLR
jgi:hypothetical protein